jgi:hypothetical protein
MLKYLKKFVNLNFLNTRGKTFARLYKSDGNNKINSDFSEQSETKVEIISNKEDKFKNLKVKKPKTINIETTTTTEDIKITPYFSKAVSEKEKSHTNVSVSALITQKKAKTTKLKESRKKILEQKKNVIIENIKRELPKEL